MFAWIIISFTVAVLAAAFGFGSLGFRGPIATAADFSKIVFAVSMVLFIVTFVMHRIRHTR